MSNHITDEPGDKLLRWKVYAAWCGVLVAALMGIATAYNSWAVLPWRVTRNELEIKSVKDSLAPDHDLLIRLNTKFETVQEDVAYIRRQLERNERRQTVQ